MQELTLLPEFVQNYGINNFVELERILNAADTGEAFLTLQLLETLSSENIFEDYECRMRRSAALDDIIYWIDECLPTCYICLTGSMLLNTATRGSDIDLIVIGPSAIDESLFMNKLTGILMARGIAPRMISLDLMKVFSVMHPTARIKIDVIYVNLIDCNNPIERSSISALINTNNLNSQYYKISCYRTMSFLKNIMRDKPSFKIILGVVKHWAKANSLYGNAGAIPGIAWTIMVAHVFLRQNTDSLSLYAITVLFFHIYSTWNWNRPVTLMKDKQAIYNLTENKLSNQRSPQTMSILLPLFPFTNTVLSLKPEKFTYFKSMTCSTYYLLTQMRYNPNIDWKFVFASTKSKTEMNYNPYHRSQH
ncbi:hypothetical protein GJ496_010553 [Pomphorhynchus laevis]|nr:hypothetical protein GJ496_010553 [Pomphorhynchus laevis]